MGSVPGVLEGATVGVLAWQVFGLSLPEAGMLGFILAAVSPAIIVPQMIELTEAGYGRARHVPTLVLASAPNYFMTAYGVLTRVLDDQPVPASLYSLSPMALAPIPTRMTRTDDRTLHVAPEGGYPWWFFRSNQDPLAPGDRVQLDAMMVEVLSVDHEGVPLEVAFHFHAPLEDDAYVWMILPSWNCEPFTPPAIGETIELNHW